MDYFNIIIRILLGVISICATLWIIIYILLKDKLSKIFLSKEQFNSEMEKYLTESEGDDRYVTIHNFDTTQDKMSIELNFMKQLMATEFQWIKESIIEIKDRITK